MQPKDVTRKHPWQEPTKEELERREIAKVEKDKAVKAAEEAVYKCLNDPKFTKYKAKYEIAERETINFLISYEEFDIVTYGTRVRIALGKIHQLRLLVKEIESDNRVKGKK